MPPNVKVLFVTVDPETDTPAVIRDFLNQFSVDFIGLTGTKEQLVDVQRQFSALVALAPNDEEGTPNDLGHDGRVFAFAPMVLGEPSTPTPLVRLLGLATCLNSQPSDSVPVISIC